MARLREVEVKGLPAHVAAWSVSHIPGFVLAVLQRWEREYARLPDAFSILMCPQTELNAMGGLPEGVHALTDPRLRCAHFTGCHRPYLVVLFTGEDAEPRRAEAQTLLPWSEGYRVRVVGDRAELEFADAREGLDTDTAGSGEARSLRSLLASGELVQVLG